MKASNMRQLMKLLVDRELAFDNRLDPKNEEYAICFLLEKKQIILNELEDNNKISLSHESDIFNRSRLEMLREELLQTLKTTEDANIFDEILFDAKIVYEAFSKHQHGDEFKDFVFVHTFDYLLEKYSQRINDDHKKLLSIQVDILIDMHHALKVGWEEIKHITTVSTYNELFINLFIMQQIESIILMRLIKEQQVQLKHRSNSRSALKIINLKKYLANPGLENENILDVIQDLYEANRALSVYDISSKYEVIVSNIKTTLGKSNNPRVRKALSDWNESGDLPLLR
jgi:hypothetical protein